MINGGLLNGIFVSAYFQPGGLFFPVVAGHLTCPGGQLIAVTGDDGRRREAAHAAAAVILGLGGTRQEDTRKQSRDNRAEPAVNAVSHGLQTKQGLILRPCPDLECVTGQITCLYDRPPIDPRSVCPDPG